MQKAKEIIVINELLRCLSDVYDDQLFEITSDLDGADLTVTISYIKDETPLWRTVDLNNPQSINILQNWLEDAMTSWLAY